MTDKNNDGSNRFKTDSLVLYRDAWGDGTLCVVEEYEEDGVCVRVRALDQLPDGRSVFVADVAKLTALTTFPTPIASMVQVHKAVQDAVTSSHLKKIHADAKFIAHLESENVELEQTLNQLRSVHQQSSEELVQLRQELHRAKIALSEAENSKQKAVRLARRRGDPVEEDNNDES